MKAPITCLITVYNEESRIRNFLAHAVKWADEIIVRDKSSTDHTVEVCREMGVEPFIVPFSRDGTFEPDAFDLCANDWVFGMTASEIPTAGLIANARKLLDERGDELDLVMVPKILWSLGVCSSKSPWHISYQPFLIHRKRATIGQRIHANFTAAPDRTGTIEFNRNSLVAHMTHTSGEAFLRKHLEYAIFEAQSDETFDQITVRCATAIETQFQGVGPGHELWAQRCGWSVYFWSIMMLAAEKGKDHSATYDAIAKQLLEQNWK